uniref:Histone H3-like 1 n=2 Tax=Lilium longiflorum TaxID=4690 RepID=H3L1_LILLO|nr:RecName: Full=Histone H3-like 1; AltName: Full=Generative cell-specific histone H3; AltName: Full=Histone gH3 [Lilium longiflorum]BAA96098.1 gH3 [Lilium longiflorum]BAE48429.1 histone gH3 [Lilium longiflorum]BAU79626.1 male gametic cell-specific histone H3 [Lilium longiflorum]
MARPRKEAPQRNLDRDENARQQPTEEPQDEAPRNQGRQQQQQRPPAAPRRPRRFRPGTVALREIRRIQRSNVPLIPHSPFMRLVRELAAEFLDDCRFAAETFIMLKEVVEDELVNHFGNVQICSIHAKRIIITVKDFKLAKLLKGEPED